MHSDYAVCADGSDMNIVRTQTGVVQVKKTTFGQAEAAWGTRRSGSELTGSSGWEDSNSGTRPPASAPGSNVLRRGCTNLLALCNFLISPRGVNF
jgi:hypothetical protein